MTQSEIISFIVNSITEKLAHLEKMWSESRPVQHFYIDDLLPIEVVVKASEGFPSIEQMNRRSSIREKKYTSAKMMHWGESTRDVFLALQSKGVMQAIEKVTGIKNLVGDPNGYAGGISAMEKNDFLNPHLDNSSHPKIDGYRRLNALFYVTPDWELHHGGNLELWSPDLKQKIEVASKFNRLVVMNTNNQSLHSVNHITEPRIRKCISNYYFNDQSPMGKNYHHITSFRGRPNEPFKDLYLRLEGFGGSCLQTLVGKPLKKGEQ